MNGGLAGFLVILALVVGAVLLFRSMNKHLRRVPPTFDEMPPAPPGAPEHSDQPDQPDQPPAQSSPRD
jgi:hypothetical protein